MDCEWKKQALAEIEGIKSFWSRKYGWAPVTNEGDDHVDLFITFRRAKEPDRRFVLKLRYEKDFKTAGRREDFVDPEDLSQAGEERWPQGVRGFKSNRKRPAICLEGTYGFHSDLHQDRDGRLASLNKLLLEIQQCFDE